MKNCDLYHECPFVNIKDDGYIIFGECLISKKVGKEICEVCNDDLKKLIEKETKERRIK